MIYYATSPDLQDNHIKYPMIVLQPECSLNNPFWDGKFHLPSTPQMPLDHLQLSTKIEKIKNIQSENWGYKPADTQCTWRDLTWISLQNEGGKLHSHSHSFVEVPGDILRFYLNDEQKRTDLGMHHETLWVIDVNALSTMYHPICQEWCYIISPSLGMYGIQDMHPSSVTCSVRWITMWKLLLPQQRWICMHLGEIGDDGKKPMADNERQVIMSK